MVKRGCEEARTWCGIGMLADARQLAHLVLHKREERNVDRERDQREEGGKEGNQRGEERERDVGAQREEERDKRHTAGCAHHEGNK